MCGCVEGFVRVYDVIVLQFILLQFSKLHIESSWFKSLIGALVVQSWYV